MDDHSLIVQYRVSGWGTEADQSRREQIDAILDECLRSTNNGECDGADVGSGTMNFFLIRIADVEKAKESVIAALRDAGLLEGAVIALSPPEEEYEGDEEAENEEDDAEVTGWQVLWPDNFEGEFELWYL